MNITLNEALQRLFNTFIFENINTAIPGIVEKQDGPYRVIVTPAIGRKYPGVVLNYKPIANIPLIYPRSSKACIRLPRLEKGDGVLLIFSQKALDSWLSSKTVKQVVAEDPRRFDLTDAIAIPGLFPFAIESPEPEDLDSLEIKYGETLFSINKNDEVTINNGDCTFEMTANIVKINGENLTVDK